MADKLTWDEIKRRYPDEWVVLVDYQTEGVDVVDGVVAAHGKDRDRVDAALRGLPSPSAILFTGETRGMFGFYVDDMERKSTA